MDNVISVVAAAQLVEAITLLKKLLLIRYLKIYWLNFDDQQ